MREYTKAIDMWSVRTTVPRCAYRRKLPLRMDSAPALAIRSGLCAFAVESLSAVRQSVRRRLQVGCIIAELIGRKPLFPGKVLCV